MHPTNHHYLRASSIPAASGGSAIQIVWSSKSGLRPKPSASFGLVSRIASEDRTASPSKFWSAQEVPHNDVTSILFRLFLFCSHSHSSHTPQAQSLEELSCRLCSTKLRSHDPSVSHRTQGHYRTHKSVSCFSAEDQKGRQQPTSTTVCNAVLSYYTYFLFAVTFCCTTHTTT